jgi:hypothetical protein
MPFILVVVLVLAGARTSQAQSASSPTQLVHPILKDPNNRNAPTSLDRDPSLLQDPAPAPAPHPHPAPYRAMPLPVVVQPAQPAVIVAKIDSGLAASKLTMIGTVNGLKGTMYVTNTGPREVTPVLELAICDPKGCKIGAMSKIGDALAPNTNEKIVVLATNLNAADLKLMRLGSANGK